MSDEIEHDKPDSITILRGENERLGRDYQIARDAHDKLLVENERLRAALGGIKWQSVDRDNMEFSAKITCYQLDMIRAALEKETSANTHEFVSDWYRPARCVNCGQTRDHAVHKETSA